jgi:hypothetical protein
MKFHWNFMKKKVPLNEIKALRNKASGKRTKKEKNEKKVFSSRVKFEEFEEWRWLPSEKSLDGSTCTTSLGLSHVYLRFPRHRRRM